MKGAIYKSNYDGDSGYSKLALQSLGYRRKMVYIRSVVSKNKYRVEEKDGYFYYPYITLSGLCAKINEEEAVVLVRGKEQETIKFNSLFDIKKFFNEWGGIYAKCDCINYSIGRLSIYKNDCSYNWDCWRPCSVMDLYSLTPQA